MRKGSVTLAVTFAIAIGVLATVVVLWSRFVSEVSEGFTLTSCGCTAARAPTDDELRALWRSHRAELERLARMVVPGQAPRWVKSEALAAMGVEAAQVGGGGGEVTVPVYSCSGLACPSADKSLVWTPRPPGPLVADTEAAPGRSGRYALVEDGWYIFRDGL